MFPCRPFLLAGVVAFAAGLAAPIAAQVAGQTSAPPPPPTVSGMAGVALGSRGADGPTGSVSGRAMLGDTQAPARFAQIMLIPMEVVQTDSRPGGGFRGFSSGGNARTDLNGQFTLNSVAAGDYYVAGQATGYISETALLQARAAEGADAKALLASLPTVHVSAGTEATVNVTLSRGGVISGRIQWDDGTPGAGVQVSAQMVTAGTSSTAAVNQGGGRGIAIAGLAGGFATGGGLADDRGVFRLTGLVPGTYVVRVSVQAPTAGSGGGPGNFGRLQTITLYAPGKMRRSEAQTFTVGAGEERDDLQIVLDLHALHTVTGRVGATSGPEPESGSVRLTDPSDSTLNRTGAIAADGAFTLMYVPSGSYTLTVSGASTSPAVNNAGARRAAGQPVTPGTTFQQYTGSLSVTDTDVSGVSISLTPNGG